MINIAEYQENKIIELHKKITLWLKFIKDDPTTKYTALLSAPTGSGKTLICAYSIKQVLETNDDILILWITIGQGDNANQSYLSFKEKYDLTDTYLFDGKTTSSFNEDTKIIFSSWNYLKTKNSQGETNFFTRKENMDYSFSQYLAESSKNKKIILFIDESHHTSDSELSKDIVDNIKPSITIEVSATPNKKNFNAIFEINPDDVRNSGLIKESISINDYIHVSDSITDAELLMKSAIYKHSEIKKQYEKIGINYINPLVLIQCKEEDVDELKLILIKNDIQKHQIGLWFSSTKENIDNIIKNNSSIKYLFCNQAISTGWDCPRAHILIQFINVGSKNFEIQVVGRILRTVEQKKYNNNILDTAYVFTRMDENQEYIDLFINNQEQIGVTNLTAELLGDNIKVDLFNSKLKECNILKNTLTNQSIYDYYGQKHIDLIKHMYSNYIKNKLITGKTYKDFFLSIESKTIDSINKEINQDNLNIKYVKRDFDSYFAYMSKKYNLKMIDTSKLMIPYKNEQDISNENYHDCMFQYTRDFLNENEKQIWNEILFQIKYEYEKTPLHINKIKFKKSIYFDKNNNFIQKLSKPESLFAKHYLENKNSILLWMKNFDWGNNGLSIIYEYKQKKHLHFPDFITIENNIIYLYEIKEHTEEEINNLITNTKWSYLKEKSEESILFKYDIIYVDVKNKEFFIKTQTGIKKLNISLD